MAFLFKKAEINKAAGPEFNTRVAETRLGAKVLAKLIGLEKWRSVLKFKELGSDLSGLLKSAKELLHPEPYSREEVCEILGLDEEEVVNECLTENTRDLVEFKLHDRAVHVFSEAFRVYQFKSVCDESASSGDSSTDEVFFFQCHNLILFMKIEPTKDVLKTSIKYNPYLNLISRFLLLLSVWVN